MAETVAGGAYLAADGKTLVNAHGDVIEVEQRASEGNSGRPPAIAKLAELIASLSAEEVEALKAGDDRSTAAAIYDARLAELAGE